jgi:tetratricopeptide (TPR) repeat protein
LDTSSQLVLIVSEQLFNCFVCGTFLFGRCLEFHAIDKAKRKSNVMDFKKHVLILSFIFMSSAAANASSAGEPTWQKYSDSGSQAFKERRFDDAEKYFGLAVKEAEQFGFDDDRLAASLNNLANTYSANYHYEAERGAKFKEAERLYKRALQIREKLLGPDHLEVAETLSDLAAWNQKKFNYSESLNKRALEIREKALGPEHLDVAQSLFQLAEAYSHRGKKSEAEPLYKRALKIWEKAADSDEKIALCLDGLADIDLHSDHEADAEPLLKRSLSIWEKQPKREFTVLYRLNKLATVYKKQGKQKELEETYKHCLAITERKYGADSPYVGPGLKTLAELYMEQKRYEDAEPLYARILSIRKSMLGERNSSEVAASALTAFKNFVPGINDLLPNFDNSRSESQGQAVASNSKFPAIEEARKYSSEPISTDEPGLFRFAGTVLADRGDFASAEAMLKADLVNTELCPDYDALGASNYKLGLLYFEHKKYSKAEVQFRRSARIIEKLFGSDSAILGTNLSYLAYCYEHQRNYPEAERNFKRALEIAEKTCNERRDATVSQTLKDYISLLRKTNRSDEADKIEEKFSVVPAAAGLQ